MPKLKNLFLVLATLIAMAPSSAGAADTALEVRWPAKRLWVGAINVEGIRVAAVGPDSQPIATLKGPVTIRGLKTA
ncbi:MAG: hypothetical protein AAFV29_14125, partial [Myxococcota bacterium]